VDPRIEFAAQRSPLADSTAHSYQQQLRFNWPQLAQKDVHHDPPAVRRRIDCEGAVPAPPGERKENTESR